MNIQLHPKKGLNPHLTICPRCGGEGPGLILLGNQDKVYKCPSCGQQHIGRPKKGLCQQCGERVKKEREIEERERLPGELCTKCEDEIEKFKEEVSKGGIYWKCSDCHSEGVITAASSLAKEVRKRIKISAPDPCGIEFTKKDCPSCSK